MNGTLDHPDQPDRSLWLQPVEGVVDWGQRVWEAGKLLHSPGGVMAWPGPGCAHRGREVHELGDRFWKLSQQDCHCFFTHIPHAQSRSQDDPCVFGLMTWDAGDVISWKVGSSEPWLLTR